MANIDIKEWQIGENTYKFKDEVARQQLATKQDAITQVTASVDSNVGTPSVTPTWNNGTLDLAFHNVKGEQGIQGEKGAQGDSVLVGQGDLPLAHVLGYDATKAMSQKGVTEAMDEALQAVKRLVAIEPTLVTSGSNLTKTGNNESGSPSSRIKDYDIDASKTYYVTCRNPKPSTLCGVTFYVSGSWVPRYVGDGSTNAFDIVKAPLAPPSGTTKIRVFGLVSDGNHEPMLYEAVGTIDVQGLRDDMDKVLDVLPEDVNQLMKVTEEEPSAKTTGYQLNTDGSNRASTTNAILNTYIDIDDTKRYLVTCRQSKAVGTAGVCLYDSNGDCISAQFIGDGTTVAHDVVKSELNIVEGTVRIKVFGSAIYSRPALYKIDGNIDLGELYADVEEMKSYPLRGKKIAVIGDSISTILNGNNPFIRIQSRDVGSPLLSYVSWNDVYTSNNGVTRTPTYKTIGGVTLTEDMIDGELHTFTPNENDVDKELYVPRHYDKNDASVRVWSQVLCDRTGANLIANASFSGSTMNSSTKNENSRGVMFEGSEAWHPCTIARCKARDENGNIILPDVIIIERGTNDLTYTNNGDYNEMTLDFPDMSNGITWDTDYDDITVSDGEGGEVVKRVYSFVKAYMLTIQRLRGAYPNATIICATPNIFKRVHYDRFPTRNDAWSLPDLCNCIRKIADYMGCGLIELDKDGITWENMYPTYIKDDPEHPTHPNNNGHRVMGEKAAVDLKYVLNP